jgi:selenocysteine-specific elongation factor
MTFTQPDSDPFTAKALSQTRSTAGFDKNPQSQERGITLDLGFSMMRLPAPPHIAGIGF